MSNNPDFRLALLEQNERLLAAADALRPLRNELIRELDALTRPVPRTIPKPALAGRGFEWRGEFFPARTKIELYLAVLQRIWREFPRLREKIAARLKMEGHSRSYIAVNPTALFDEWPEWKAKKYSVILADGWYADTNVGQKQMARVLRIVAEVAGLCWGAEFRVKWA